MTDPITLVFMLGLIADLLRSELRLPATIYEFVSLLPQMLAVVVLGIFLALVAFPVLRYLDHFKRADAAAGQG